MGDISPELTLLKKGVFYIAPFLENATFKKKYICYKLASNKIISYDDFKVCTL